MAKRKPTATQRLRKLVQQQVRRMENRGYRISSELKEKIKTGKYQTLQSIRRNKYAKLYEGASAEIDGDIVSGRRYRQYERKKSAEKGRETRRISTERKRGYREALDDISRYDEQEWTDADEQSYQNWKERRSQDYYDDEDYESDWEEQHWEEERAEQDNRDRQYADLIDQGEVMYNNVVDLIDKFPRAGSDILQKALSAEINKYGLDLVMAGMAQAPVDVIGEAQNIVHYAGTKENIHRSITNLFDAITGTIRSLQEAMELGSAMDAMTDMTAL